MSRNYNDVLILVSKLLLSKKLLGEMAAFWTELEEIQDDCESPLIPESKEVQEKKKRGHFKAT